MNSDLQIRSPFTAIPTCAARLVGAGDTGPSEPTDAYAGTAPEALARPAGNPAAAPRLDAFRLGRRLAVAGIGAIALVGVAGTISMQSAPLATTSTQSQTVQSSWSNPARPVPDNAQAVDEQAWQATFSKAFEAVKTKNAAGFLETLSSDGVWIRGLPEAPQTETGMLHMSHDEISKDLQQHGPFYKHVFAQRDNARLVVTPDAASQIQTILLD